MTDFSSNLLSSERSKNAIDFNSSTYWNGRSNEFGGYFSFCIKSFNVILSGYEITTSN